MASQVRVLRAPHTGITVPSLARAVHLFKDILNLPVQRTSHFSPPVSTIVGHPLAEIDAAMIELPGGHLLELLEYSSPPTDTAMKPMPWQVGSWHLCLAVESMDATIKALQDFDSGWRPMADSRKLDAGPEAGRRLIYMRNEEDGLVLELFE